MPLPFFALVAPGPKTVLIARSLGLPPSAAFSALRFFGGGLPLAAEDMPSPTLLASAGLRAFAVLFLLCHASKEPHLSTS